MWDSLKAVTNKNKHGISFERAVYVVQIEHEEFTIRIIAARKATAKEGNFMRTAHERLQSRRQKERPVTAISINVPTDVVEDLKEVATLRGFSRVEVLVRAYVGQGLREDLERLDDAPVLRLAESPRKQGLSEKSIADVLAEANLKIA